MKTHKKQAKNARYHLPGLLKRDTLLRCLKISYLSRYTKNIIRYILLFMTFISFSVFADSGAIPINLSGISRKIACLMMLLMSSILKIESKFNQDLI